MQRYLLPHSSTPFKLRVLWRTNKPVKSFLIKNLVPYTTVQPKRFSLTQKKASGHLHDLNDFPYAGQVFSSSFNAFLPHKAIIPAKDTKAYLSPEKACLDPSVFVAKVSSLKVTVEEVKCEDEVIRMVEEFVEIFNEKREKNDKKRLSEVLIDFICEGKQWVLVKVKSFKVDYLPSKIIKNPLMSPQLLRRSIVDTEMVEKIFAGVDEGRKYNGSRLTQANLWQRLSKIENKSNLIKNSRLGHIDLNDILLRNVENYKRCSPSVMVFPSMLTTEHGWSVNEAVKRYDEFRSNLKSSLR